MAVDMEKQLSDMYDAINGALYGGELDKIEVIITYMGEGEPLGDAVGALQRPSLWYGGDRYGIAINLKACLWMREAMGADMAQVLAETLAHEMAHLWCKTRGQADTIEESGYHTEAFRDAALAHGQECELSEETGWSATGISLEGWLSIQEWCEEHGMDYEETFTDAALYA